MPLRIRPILAALLAVGLLQATASAGLIFDNTIPGTGNQGVTTAGTLQIGDKVTAALGTSRLVTELDLGLTSQNISATATVQAFLYANDGASGAPGTLLWQSSLTNISINSYNMLFAFAVPSILVPDTFTFTGLISNASSVVGFVPASGASVGTFVQAYAGSPGSFFGLSNSFEIAGRVIASDATAVPEPSTIVLVGMGLVGLVAFNRSRRTSVAAH